MSHLAAISTRCCRRWGSGLDSIHVTVTNSAGVTLTAKLLLKSFGDRWRDHRINGAGRLLSNGYVDAVEGCCDPLAATSCLLLLFFRGLLLVTDTL